VPSHLCILPVPGQPTVSLATFPPLATFTLEPLNFFDARSDGLNLHSKGLNRVAAEESQIVRFVRTSEGKGVAVVRKGGGEAWYVRERGTQLVRANRWITADHVVVLNGGTLCPMAAPFL